MADDSISPELALVDPDVGRVIDSLEPAGNGAPPARDGGRVATLLYDAGMITADQLGELARDSVLLGLSEIHIALERGMVDAETLHALLAPQPAPAAFIERVDVTALPPDIVEQLEATGQSWVQEPEPDEPAAVPETDSPAAYSVLLRFENGERVPVHSATSYADAIELARSLAAQFADPAEWPFAGGRFIRPATVVSVDLERALED